ncbi:MAG: response regulator [Candidatus Omnitrophota bacterium]|nr:response regulator [Candidatus Omnitrophota bacterium]
MTAFKPKILLVDDEAEARSGLAHALKMKGYEVVEVGTGTEALARARGEWPALIILDVVLPDIPGTEVLKKLRADAITRAIPVLLLTAKPDILELVGTEIPSFEGTRDRYFEKPGRVDELLAVVHQMLTGKT